ncbi:DUF4214 domain-containing protein [Massilia antarctica]|uniref:DUF4214 domain-containing protein n=1 Tax=Massilia antarctica TaxID=2765360 RepID=UPI001E2FA10C|nr:DUF4214 domain-containing protein [Massilia antarctica]
MGVLTNSGTILGREQTIGAGQYGATGEKVVVNAKTGNLVIQGRDEFVPSNANAGISVVRTYNSLGLLNDDNGDNWKLGLARKLTFSGDILTSSPSSITITRFDGDDSSAVYTYAGVVSGTTLSRYTTSDGAGGLDQITWNPTTKTWGWSDGNSYEFDNYDVNGRLNVSRGVYYAYNADGMLASVKDNTGGGTFFTYDSTKKNNLVRVDVSYPKTLVNGVPGPQEMVKRVSYAYDAQNRLSEVRTDLTPANGSIVDGDYYWTRYTYEGDSRRVSTITQKDGGTLTVAYEALTNRVRSVTDNMAETETFTYVSATRTDVLNQDGMVTSFEHDAAGRLSAVTARPASGPVEVNRYKYDARGNVIEIADADGGVTTKQYDAYDNCIFERNPVGEVIKRTFDPLNRKSPITESVYMLTTTLNGVEQYASPATTRFIYDQSGENVRYVIGPENNVTEYRYNNLAQRTHAIEYTVLKEAVPAAAMSGDYRKQLLDTMAALTYPQRKNVVLTSYTYNPHGQVATATTFGHLNEDGSGKFDGTESTVQFTRDHAGNLLQQIDALGNQRSYLLDGLGRVLTAVTPTTTGSATTKTVYNGTPVLRLVGGQYRMTTQSTVTYADAHRLITTSDALGRVISSEVQDAGQVPMATTLYGYDSAGRLNMVQDPAGVKSYIFYDAAGRRGLTVDGDGSAVRYIYSAAGDLTKTTRFATAVNVEMFASATGKSISQLRAENLAVSPSPADRHEWRAYDQAGRLSRTVDHAGYVIEYRYDRASRLERTIAYANAIATGSGASASLEVPAASPDDRIKTITHLLTGSVSGMSDSLGATLYERDQTGKQKGIWENGMLNHEVAYYNQKGLLSGQVDADGYFTDYDYDLNGNVIRKTRYATAGTVSPGAGQTWTYQYVADQLTRETAPDGTVTVHVYDAMGSRISSTAAYNTSEARTSAVRRDAMGRIIAELSAEGAALLRTDMSALEVSGVWNAHAIKYTYDGAGHRTSMTDQAGNKAVYYYDRDGRLAAAINGEGDVEYREYSVLNELSRVTRFATQMDKTSLPALAGGALTEAIRNAIASRADGARDIVRSYEYNNLGQVVRETTGGGANLIGYNAFGEVNGRVDSIGDGRAASSEMTYDVRGNLKTRTTPSYRSPALVETYSYDALNRQIYKSVGGVVTQTDYDHRGNATLVKDVMTQGEQRKYDAFGRATLETSALGYKTTYDYSTEERKVTITTPEGAVTSIISNRHGERQSVTVGNTTTTYDYDRAGRLKAVIDGVGTAQQKHYDAAGRLDVITDGNGTETRISYDAAGRVLTSIVDPGGLNLVTRYSYDGIGQVLSVIDPAGVTTQSQYDNRGYLIALTTDATGLKLTTRFTYDNFGRTTSVANANGALTTFTYDEMGRHLSETVDSGGEKMTTSFAYDEAGNVRTRTDANGNIIHFYYDLNNRMSSQVDANGSVTSYVYDGHNQVVRTRTFSEPVDIALLPVVMKPTLEDPVVGMVAAHNENLDRVMHNVYDQDGRLRFTVDGTGAVVERAYNHKNQVYATVAYANRVVPQVAHDLAGMLKLLPALSENKSYAVTHLRYDARGRVSDSINGEGGLTHYDYDGNGKVTSITGHASEYTPAVTRQRMSYDGAGRLTFSAQAQAVDANGNASSWSVVHQEYDKAGNVIARTAYASALTAPAPDGGASSAVVAQWLAGVGADPARDQQERYVYDGANRQVASAKAQHGQDGVLQWSVVAQAFDKVGNVVVRTAFADFRSSAALGNNPSQQEVVQWLGAGTPNPNPARDNITHMVYDGANRLRFAVDGIGAVSENRYDGLGNVVRQRKFTGIVAVTAAPLTEAAFKSVLAEPVSDVSARVTDYTYDGAGRVATIDDHHGPLQEREYDALGHLLLTRHGERIERFAYDTDGKLRFSVDAGGYVKETVYDGVGRLSRTVQYTTALVDMAKLALRNPVEVRAKLTIDDALDRKVGYEYDAMGNLLSSTDALGVSERFEYDALGRKTGFVNGMGSRWTYDYDAAGRLSIERSPEVLVSADDTSEKMQSMVTRIAYDAFGNVRERTEAAGTGATERVTRYEYDLAGRQVKTTSPIVPVYNPAGEKYVVVGIDRSETTPLSGATTTVVYDAAGRAIKNIDALGNVTQKIYSARGDLLFDIDALGNVTGYEHDAHGNVTRLTRYADSIASATAQRQVTELFLVVIGRAPNADDVSYWSAKFKAGATFAGIAMQLLVEPEADKFYPGGGDLRSFVAQVFSKAFGRSATDAEFNNWLAMAQAPGVTRGAFIDTVLHNIEGAAELRAWNAKLDAVLPARADLAQQVAVTQLYAALLDRSPTPAELANGLVLLQEGMSQLDLANKLLDSFEGTIRYPSSADPAAFVAALSQAMLHRAPGADLADLAGVVTEQSRAHAVLALIARMGSSEASETDRNMFAARVKANLGLSPVAAPAVGAVDAASLRAALARSDAAANRAVEMTYDFRDKVLTTLEGKGQFYQSLLGATKMQAFEGRRLTTKRYNAFGELVEQRVSASVDPKAALTEATVAAVTRYDYNSRGQKITEVVLADAGQNGGPDRRGVGFRQVYGAYVTQMDYDMAGNVVLLTEHATAINAVAWMTRTDWMDGSVTMPEESAPVDGSAADWLANVYGRARIDKENDRVTKYSYDGANRKEAQWESYFVDHGNEIGDVTRYRYDKVGNLTETENALGGITRSNYDALGRVTSVTGSAGFDAGALEALVPDESPEELRYTLTAFKRDIHGNVLRTITYADGSATLVSPVLNPVSDKDRVSYTRYDRNGHAIQMVDAQGHASFASYDALGRVVRQWEGVTRLNSGIGRGETVNTVFKIYHYDALGQVDEVASPGTSTTIKTDNPLRLTRKASSTNQGKESEKWNGTNQIFLSYPPLPAGEVRVDVRYTNANGNIEAQRSATGEATSATITWYDVAKLEGGLGTVLSAVVSVKGADGVWKQIYAANAQQLEMKLVNDGAADAADIKREKTDYNSFGEVVQRSVDGVAYEYTRYDNNGRVWRTNANDGVDKIMVHNVAGQVTLQLRSAATGAGSAGDISYKSIKDVNLGAATFERTETEYDLMGRVQLRYTPGSDARNVETSQLSKIVVPQINQVHNFRSGTKWSADDAKWTGSNIMQVDFSVPADLGAGDIMVRVDYINHTVGSPQAETYQQAFDMSQLSVDQNGHWSAQLKWEGQSPVRDANFSSVQLFKKDVNSVWQLIAKAENVVPYREIGKAEKELGPFLKIPALVTAGVRIGNGPIVDLDTMVFGDTTLVDLSGISPGNFDILTFLPMLEGEYKSRTQYDSTSITLFGTPGADRYAVINIQKLAPKPDVQRRAVVQQSDRWGNVVYVSDPRDVDLAAHYRYNSRNQRTGEDVVRQWFDDRDMISVTQLSSASTEYDVLGRQVATWSGQWPDESGTTQVYDIQGNLALQRNALGVITRSKFNLFGERIQLIQPIKAGQAAVTNYGYDKLGRVTRSWMDHLSAVKLLDITTGSGMVEEVIGIDLTLDQLYRYDELGRRISSTNSDGGETRTRYDLDGNVASTTDESGVIMRYAYDSFHRKIFEQDAMGKKNTWHYEGGLLVNSTNMGDTTTQYGYDGLRHMTFQKDIGQGKNLAYTYDCAGLLTKVEDLALKQVTTYAYDQAGNRVREKTVITDAVQAKVGEQFPQSPEAVQIAGIHLAVFGRTAELGELLSWESQYKLGTASYLFVAEQLLTRAEAQARLPSGLGDAEFINTLYQLTVGHIPDTATHALHLTKLESGVSRGQIVLDMMAGLNGGELDNFNNTANIGLHPATTTGLTQQVVVQDNHTTYDLLNRMARVTDGRYDVVFAYDTNGNRVKVDTTYTDAKGKVVTTHAVNTYDALNRQLIVNGEYKDGDPASTVVIGKFGHKLEYDYLGNRTSDTYLLDPEKSETPTVDTYEYDNAGRLTIARRGEWIIDMRSYDMAGRLAHAGVSVQFEPGREEAYRAALKEWKLDAGTRAIAYDKAGRIVRQKEFHLDGTASNDIKYVLGGNDYLSTLVGYDAAGHLKGYYVVPPGSLPPGQYLYTTQYTYFDSYRQKGLTVRSGEGVDMTANMTANTTTSDYDVNGHLVKINDPAFDKQAVKSRTFVNDAAGHVLRATTGDQVTHALVVNDQMLGATGGTLTDVNPGIFASTYEPASVVAASNVPFVYIVQQDGETLQSIAGAIWGDGKLWYLIADANGVSDGPLKAGLSLQIPARVNTVHNDYRTYKPYDPSVLVGDMTPALPPMAPNAGCNQVGMIVMIVVAVVATILTAGAAAPAAAGVASGAAAGGAVAGGAVAGGAVAGGAVAGGAVAGGAVAGGAVAGGAAVAGSTVAVGAVSTVAASTAGVGLAGAWSAGVAVMTGSATLSLGTVAAAALGSAVGSIASQSVGMMMGMQDSINWSAVGASALGGAITAGVAGWAANSSMPILGGSQFYNIAARAALGSALTQGISSVTKMQDGFKWRNVAAAGIAAGAAAGVSQAIGTSFGTGFFGDVARGTVSGIVAGAMVRMFTGGKFNLARVATDAFGNALGNALGSSIKDNLSPEISEKDVERLRQQEMARISSQSADESAWNPAIANGYSAANASISGAAVLSAYSGQESKKAAYSISNTLRQYSDDTLLNESGGPAWINRSTGAMGFAVEAPYVERLNEVVPARPVGYWAEVPTASDPSGYSMSTERVWVPGVTMPHGEQMRHMGMVANGSWKGVVNGVPKLTMAVVSTLGKWSIMADMNEQGYDRRESERVAENAIAGLPTGEIFAYNNVEERIGGFGGELLSPYAYGKVVQVGAKGVSLYRSIPDEFGQFASTGGASADTVFPNHLSFVNRAPDEVFSAEPVPLLSKEQALRTPGKILYVVKEDGTLVIGRLNSNNLYGHFDLAKGGNVLAAGEGRIFSGQVKFLDNASGHYVPSGPSAQDAAIRAFTNAGFKVPDAAYVQKIYDFRLGKWVPQ